MPTARTRSVALNGLDGHLVEIEADIADGLPATILVGLPDSALREARDRIRAAILNSGVEWPKRKITIGLTPTNIPKRGSAYDLAIAIALLAANEVIPLAALEGLVFLAELGLDGRLRPVPGITPAISTAVAGGMTTIVVAAGNKAEVEAHPGIQVIGAENLAQIVDWLRGDPPPDSGPPFPPGPHNSPVLEDPDADFRDYSGPPEARLAAEICAAGGHNLSIVGRRCTGKLMLAERLPGILPDLCEDHSFQATCVHSAAGRMLWGQKRIIRPPFLRPHHTCSVAAMIGGGSLARPGAASLAHRGVLLLEDAPEFSRDVLDALRQPIETGQVTLMRADSRAWTFPARFQLVLSATPCPCGSPNDQECECSSPVRRRYLGRLAGPLVDQIEVKVALEPATSAEIRKRLRSAEPSQVIAERVAAARERSARRLRGTPWRLNSEIPCSEMHRSYLPYAHALREVERLIELGCVSNRGARKILRVAWTIADMAGRDRPDKDEVHVALRLFLGGKGRLTFSPTARGTGYVLCATGNIGAGGLRGPGPASGTVETS